MPGPGRGAAGAYAAGHSGVFQALSGDQSCTSVAAQTEYDEDGRMILNLPDTERVPVD